MSDSKLGELIGHGNPGKDAIHIAIAPVIAAEKLKPGQHVGFVKRNTTDVGVSDNPIGIIDPFLKGDLEPGDKCWMCLYPQTITGLRHDWTHPAYAFEDINVSSRKWIEEFADKELNHTYSRLMEAARRWVDYEDYTYDNSEVYKDVPDHKWNEFWDHYESVTKSKVKNKDSFFTCSC